MMKRPGARSRVESRALGGTSCTSRVQRLPGGGGSPRIGALEAQIQAFNSVGQGPLPAAAAPHPALARPQVPETQADAGETPAPPATAQGSGCGPGEKQPPLGNRLVGFAVGPLRGAGSRQLENQQGGSVARLLHRSRADRPARSHQNPRSKSTNVGNCEGSGAVGCGLADRGGGRGLNPSTMCIGNARCHVLRLEGRVPARAVTKPLFGVIGRGAHHGHRATGKPGMPCALHRICPGLQFLPPDHPQKRPPSAAARVVQMNNAHSRGVVQLVVATIFASAARFPSRSGSFLPSSSGHGSGALAPLSEMCNHHQNH